MILTKTKIQLHGQFLYAESLSSILGRVLAAQTIVIKSATLLGTGGCLALTNFLSLENTLWLFLIPLALGFLPFVIGQKTFVGVNYNNAQRSSN